MDTNSSVSLTLTQFLNEHKVSDASEATHFCMNGELGGKFKVDEVDHRTFYKLYVKALKQSQVLYLTERCVGMNVFKYFIDIDFDYTVSLHDFDLIVKVILRGIDPDNKGLTANYVLSSRNQYKYHLNFPNCYLNKQQSLKVTREIVKRLEDEYPLTKINGNKVSWSKCIDTSVYGTGLRMLGSRKSTKHVKKPEVVKYEQDIVPEYKKADLTPPFGDNPQAKDFGICYRIRYIDGFDYITNSHPSESDLLQTSIRYGIPEEMLQMTGSSQDAQDTQDNGIPDIAKEGGKAISVEVQSKLRPFIVQYFHHQPSHIGAMKVKNKNDKPFLYIQLIEKWCPFQQKSHQGNNQYIIVGISSNDNLFMAQKCHDVECLTKFENRMEVPEDMEEVLCPVFNRTSKQSIALDNATAQQASDCAKYLLDLDDKDVVIPFTPKHTDLEEGPCLTLEGTYRKFSVLCRSQTCVSTVMQVVFCEHGLSASCPECHSRYPMNGELAVPRKFTLIQKVFITNNLFLYQPEASDPLAFVKDGYEVFDDTALNTSFLRSLWGTHSLIAKFLFDLYKDDFRVDRPNNVGKALTWFEFNGVIWQADSHNLHSYMFDEDCDFLGYYYKTLQHYQSISTDEDKESIKKVNHIQKVIDNLHNAKFQDQVMSQCARIWYKKYPDFLRIINTKNICAFTNGVYDFDEMVFREGRPEDFQTFSTNMEYKPFLESDQDVQLILQFIHGIIPDETVVDYLLKALSTCLTIDTSMQKFFMLVGVGSNGKSQLVNLIESCFGDYSHVISSAMLTNKRESVNSANEALASCKTKRIVMFNEVAKDAIIQADIMKMLSGGDTISTRENYGKQMKFKPKFKTFLICNLLPQLSENSFSEWRRVRVVNFPMKFVPEPDPKKPNERLIDPYLGKRLEAASPAFLSILIEYYKRFKTEGLTEPRAVVEHTKKYQDQNDKYKVFFETCIVEDAGSYITTAIIYPVFEVWFRQEYGERAPGKKEFTEYLEKNICQGVKAKNHRLPDNLKEEYGDRTHVFGWKGYKFSNPFEAL